MIPKAAIDAWRAQAPWAADYQVEQDLVISRALVEIYSDPLVARRLAFRGGTALYKLRPPPARYSEDIDLVQVEGEPIGAVVSALRGHLDTWLGIPKRGFSEGRVTLTYRFGAEGVPPVRLRLKVEINSREHFSVFGLQEQPFVVRSRWYEGEARLLTYGLDELLGTKLRALYQRRKGRDLFDLWYGLVRGAADPERVVQAFLAYLQAEGHPVSRADFEENLAIKAEDEIFLNDVTPLLATGVAWRPQDAIELVSNELIARIPGKGWKGGSQG